MTCVRRTPAACDLQQRNTSRTTSSFLPCKAHRAAPTCRCLPALRPPILLPHTTFSALPHPPQAAELKFNCFFLMPLVDSFPARLRKDIECAYEEVGPEPGPGPGPWTRPLSPVRNGSPSFE